MEAPRLERKLVAILAADVEGYSRHMERDEAATLATLSRHRLIVDDLIARGVRDHLRNKGLFTFEDLGEQSVKNIAQHIRAFRVQLEGVPPTETVPDRPVATPVGTESSVSDPAAFELAFWDTIKDSADPAEFEAYREQYPDGPFAKLAEARRPSREPRRPLRRVPARGSATGRKQEW